jgi:hypothetical protein
MKSASTSDFAFTWMRKSATRSPSTSPSTNPPLKLSWPAPNAATKALLLPMNRNCVSPFFALPSASICAGRGVAGGHRLGRLRVRFRRHGTARPNGGKDRDAPHQGARRRRRAIRRPADDAYIEGMQTIDILEAFTEKADGSRVVVEPAGSSQRQSRS